MSTVPNKAKWNTVTVILKIKGICSVSLWQNNSVFSIVVSCFAVYSLTKSLTVKRYTVPFLPNQRFGVSCLLCFAQFTSFSSYIASIIATDFQWHTESKHSEILFNWQLKIILNISNKIKSNKKATIKLVGKFSTGIETIVTINNINTIKK